MFRWVRCASVVRLALGVAVLASIAAGFGLHPEPADSGIAPAGAGIAAKAAIPPVSHGCLACLTCGAAIVRPLAAVILCSAASVPAQFSVDSDLSSRPAGRDLSGRSPPSRS